MTDQAKEMKMRVSLLLDSELDGRDNPRLIDSIESDAELQSTWARYSLIGDAIRAPESKLLASHDFAAKISELVADEPTVLAPRALKPVLTHKSKVVNFALAASLAVAAVLVGKSVNEHADVFQMASKPAENASQLAANSSEQAESQLNDYLVMHNESSYMAGSAAMLPYARVIGSGSGR